MQMDMESALLTDQHFNYGLLLRVFVLYMITEALNPSVLLLHLS